MQWAWQGRGSLIDCASKAPFLLVHLALPSLGAGRVDGSRIPGDHRQLAIPVLIPNTVVKQLSPMILQTRESRLSPGFSSPRSAARCGGFFIADTLREGRVRKSRECPRHDATPRNRVRCGRDARDQRLPYACRPGAHGRAVHGQGGRPGGRPPWPAGPSRRVRAILGWDLDRRGWVWGWIRSDERLRSPHRAPRPRERVGPRGWDGLAGDATRSSRGRGA